MMFVPLATVPMGTLAQKDMGNATGVFNLMRNIGGSVGIAYLVTFLSRHAQINQAILISHLTPWSPAYQHKLGEIRNYFETHLGSGEASRRAGLFIYNELLRQSQLLAFVEGFQVLVLISLICILGVFLLKKVKPRGISLH
jgi:DHA2 family multidrug resistance protein